MKRISSHRIRQVWPAFNHALAICLLSMVCIGCGGGSSSGGGGDGKTPDPTPYALNYAYLQFRTFESGNNYYQRVIGIKDDRGQIQETDIIDVRMTDLNGSIVNTETGGFYDYTFMLLDCMSGTCSQSGPFEDNGIWGIYSMLAEGTYDIEIEMENGQVLSTNCDYQGRFELPYVSSNSMLANWNDGNLILSWDNPDTAPAWSEVDQLRINVYDNNGNFVLRIKTVPSATTVTIPAALVSKASNLLGGDSLAQWLVQTRAHDANNMNFARGHSSRISIPPQPTNGISAITPGKWTGIADFGDIEFEVTSDGTGISSFSYDFLNYTCGPITKNGSGTNTWPRPLDIVNSQINFDTLDLEIGGTFETSGDFISGSFKYHYDTLACSGTWTAQPATSN